ncbi:MAG: ribosome biogenesis GTPase Der [Myxococcota bacterium]|nr:ribosome biogenesis GTPase Der [Myxococcota bacterium]
MSDISIRRQLPLIALVGRPNVGKSTLFNRLVRKRIALVDDQPGVTRDRLFGEVRFDGKIARIADTGGLDAQATDTVMMGVRGQTRATIEEADVVLVVLDAQVGLTAADREVVDAVRKAGKLKFVVANKIDVDDHKPRVADFAELGVDGIFGVSAEHDRGTEPLLEAVFAVIDAPNEEAVTVDQSPIEVAPEEGEEASPEPSRIEWKGGPIRVAVIGRPNAGKSSLVNRLLGEERLLATDVPGTTRDAIDVAIEHDGTNYVFVDTAGMRRKRSVDDKLEKWSVSAAVRSLDSADIALLLLDSNLAPSEQDARIATLAHERGKGLVIVANKWDVAKEEAFKKDFDAAVLHEMKFATYASIIKVSAKTGWKTETIFPAVLEAQRERHRRVTTGELNRFMNDVVERNPPPVQNSRRPRIYFASQPLVRPPTFIFTASKPEDIHFSYQRFLQNQLRERYGFHGTPVWLKFRRTRKER